MLKCYFDIGGPITLSILTINIGNSNKLKDGYDDKRIRSCISVHEL